MNLKGYKGIVLQFYDNTPEAKQIQGYSFLNDFPIIRIQKKQEFPIEYVPSGCVEWCLKLLNKPVIPDYYPSWLQNHLYRDVWKTDKWPLGKKVFIKPADKHKRFDGKITKGTWSGKKKGPYWCSNIVSFVNEWRYYIADGKILCGEWYWGKDEGIEAPILNMDIPKDYCGCLDFGILSSGEFALVEANEPFSCGWYGDPQNIELYIQWLISGWVYMKNYK